MQRALKMNVIIGQDHLIRIPLEIPEGPAEVIVIPTNESPNLQELAARRGMGLDAGQFVVPEDFDSPLPWDIQKYFEGEDSPSH